MVCSSAERLNIGQAAARSGVSAKMIRYYESLGLLPKVGRTESGYRQYGAAEVHTLRFIRRARTLGFGMAEIAALLQLWQDRERASKEVKRIALERIEDLEKKIGEMQAMKNTLENLALGCQGDDRPDCPILDDLASQRPELPKSRPLDQILP
ncbi:Cu(I)-responsive transcriptional regulator [Methylogaea oryzae]|uniref:Cu(I)-responsive transcriptional regulator n=1 Tax=Methylogaea oryzae TaxID=1295382 RepID=A0A8D5AKB1_9GAMM|nr:Cu(I)-responsive transcriptional regulator [Methylogaea oryzae]BBL70936.1 Cu(I)-responsive transcriptional regulator [Methylogaea oryzae]